MAYKKKLYQRNSLKKKEEIETFTTKRKREKKEYNSTDIERLIRERLAKKISGTLLGVWLLIPEYLRLGAWDLLKVWTGGSDNEINPRLAMQMVNESALCVSGIRKQRSLNHQGFELANGLPFIATDQQIHKLLDSHTIEDAKLIQIKLAILRKSLGHYDGSLIAFDPHRIQTYSKRIMPKKKYQSKGPSKYVIQTFFSLDTKSGQPIVFLLGSSGKTVSRSSIELLEMINLIFPESSSKLLLADSEHESQLLFDYIIESKKFNIIMPAARRKKIMEIILNLPYKKCWPGYAISETEYKFKNSTHSFRLIGQRTGEKDYDYKPFFATGESSSLELITEKYPERWSIEDFFNFDGAMGWNRASTLNLNIRYGKMTLALIAQAATYQVKKKLPKPYKTWTASHFANSILRGMDGDLKVKNDTIIVTFYNAPQTTILKQHYENLPKKLMEEGIDPRVPWLFNFKVDFRFK